MKTKLYSYVLVTVQFICIALLLFLNPTLFTKSLPLLIFFIGITFFIYALSVNKFSNFNIIPDIKKDALLVTSGAYKYIRHPMYFAVLITMLSALTNAFIFTNIATAIILTTTIFLKAKKEEYLWSQKSQEYKNYIQKTKMLIPFVF